MEIRDSEDHNFNSRPISERIDIYEVGFDYLSHYLKQRDILRQQLFDGKKPNIGQIEVADGGRRGGMIDCRYLVGPEETDQYAHNTYRQSHYLFMEERGRHPYFAPHARLLMTELVDNYTQGTLTYSFHLTHLFPSGEIESIYDQKVIDNKDREMVEHGSFGPFVDVNYDDVTVYDYSGEDLMLPDIGSRSITLDKYLDSIQVWRAELEKTLGQVRAITLKHTSE